jgi:uncharacterized membrane protein YphA (DoxX/SURF4 family)
MKDQCCGSGMCADVKSKGVCCSSIAYSSLFLRLSLGGMLLFLGINKFMMGSSVFTEMAGKGFTETWLPMGIVTSWLSLMPFLEVVLGALLFFGLYAKWATRLTGFFFVVLMLGGAISQNEAMLLPLFIYLFAVIFLHEKPQSSVSLDKAFGCKTC